MKYIIYNLYLFISRNCNFKDFLSRKRRRGRRREEEEKKVEKKVVVVVVEEEEKKKKKKKKLKGSIGERTGAGHGEFCADGSVRLLRRQDKAQFGGGGLAHEMEGCARGTNTATDKGFRKTSKKLSDSCDAVRDFETWTR